MLTSSVKSVKISYWTQGLSQEPDLIFENEEWIDPSSAQAKDFCQKINNITSTVRPIYPRNKARKNVNDVQVFIKGSQIVMHIIPEERDESNRRVPIVVYLNDENFKSQEEAFLPIWISEKVKRIRDFVQEKMARNIAEDTLHELRIGLTISYLHYRNWSRWLNFFAGIIVAIIVPIFTFRAFFYLTDINFNPLKLEIIIIVNNLAIITLINFRLKYTRLQKILETIRY